MIVVCYTLILSNYLLELIFYICHFVPYIFFFFFFFNDTATTEIYTLSLHDALPIYVVIPRNCLVVFTGVSGSGKSSLAFGTDRKSTRLNSSHTVISYAVFCLKKKKNKLGTVSTSYKSLQTDSIV